MILFYLGKSIRKVGRIYNVLNYDQASLICIIFFSIHRLYGNYENLEAGLTTDALIDMSGKIT